jgi:predicted lipid-binding transport protein (Tim44 family)
MDILIFAAIAFFIFFKLRGQLGKIDEVEKKQIQEKISKKRQVIENLQNQILVGQGKTKDVVEVQSKADEEVIGSLDENSKKQFLEIIKSCNISATFFLNGAKGAFEMIIKAFASGDLEALKFLLDSKIYSGFEQSVNQRKSAQQTLISNLIAFEKVKIISASKNGKEALVTVKFISQQINCVVDKEDQIIEGSKSEIAELTDIWTFKKDVTVSDPNWLIVSTNSN